MKKLCAAVAAACVLSAHAAPPADTADAALRRIYDTEWPWRVQQRLEDEEDDTHGIRPDLPRVDAATQQARQRYWENVLKQLDGVDARKLSPEAQVNYAVYRAQVQALVAAQRFREYEKPLNADSAFWSNLTYEARKPFRTKDDYTHYVAQLNDVPRYFREQTANMRAGLARGFTPPRVTLEGRDASIAAVADGYQVFAVIDASGTYSKMAEEITLARVVQAGVVPMDTAAVASEIQRTWNRDDAQQWAEVYTKIFPNYQLLIESYLKAQDVQKNHEQLDSQRS